MKRFCIFLSLTISFICNAIAQENILDNFKNMNMRSIGPAVTSGRVTAIDVLDSDENIIYAGTASGGLWKSDNGGVNWVPMFDKQPISGIGALCIDPSNPDIVWAGTGEGNPRNSQTSGRGIYRSPDAGRSWKLMGLEDTRTIHRVIAHPSNGDIVYAGAHGSAWGPTPHRGVYRTTNGGESWEKILFINDTVGCADLVMDPQNPNKLFAAMYQYHREPWHFTSGGKGSGLHMTLDGGKSWTRLNEKNGLPEGDLGRIGLAISHSNPRIVYALVESAKTALYKSTDGGFKWEIVNENNVRDRPFYYHELYVDPQNENHLIYLHSIVSESIDGGKTWSTLLPYYGVHPDHHAFWWSRTDSRFMVEGNDGGLNISRDGGRSWTYAGNLPLGQFYHIDYDMDTPYHVYGGMQDNGSWKGPGYVWHGGGIRNEDWQEVLFGDGFDVIPYRKDSRYVFAMYQGGELYKVDSESGESQYIKPIHPEGKALRFHWNSGLAQDPFNDCGIYYGSQYLHYSDDCGMSWKILSPDLSTNDTTKLKQAVTGGLTIDNTSAEMHCTILSIAPAHQDKNVVWIGTDDGQVQLTTDGGKTWKNVTGSIPGLPKGAWVPQIVAGLHKTGEAFVVANNYRQNDWKPYLFHTTDFGRSWKNLVDEKKVSGHCLSVVQDPVEPKLIFAGTENGLYVSFDYGNTWNKWMNDYPSVPTQDLKIHPREHDLIIGTFGRAAWILDDITPLRKFASEGKPMLENKLVALHTPDAYQVNYIQPRGQRFPADAHYAGENKVTAAVLGYYFKPEPEKTKEDKEKQASKAKDKKNDDTTKKSADTKVTIWIMTLGGDTLRTLKQEPDTGVNHMYWFYDTKGIRFPQRRERKQDDEEPGNGFSVEPGLYKVVYKFNEFKDSVTFNVLADPRTKWNAGAYARQRALNERMTTAVRTADEGMEQLKAAQKSISMVKEAWSNVPDSLKKDILARADSLSGKIKELQRLYSLPEDTPGIQDESMLLNSRLYTAYGYISSGSIAPSANADDAVRIAEAETRKVADQINKFFETDWTAWKKQVESVDFSLFREIKKL